MESKEQGESAPDTTKLGRAISEIRDGMADFETRILWCENMLTTSNAGLEKFELPDEETLEALHILTGKDKQKAADIMFLAKRLKALETGVMDFEEQFQNFLRSLYQKAKDTSTNKGSNYIYSSIKEEDSEEKPHTS